MSSSGIVPVATHKRKVEVHATRSVHGLSNHGIAQPHSPVSRSDSLRKARRAFEEQQQQHEAAPKPSMVPPLVASAAPDVAASGIERLAQDVKGAPRFGLNAKVRRTPPPSHSLLPTPLLTLLDCRPLYSRPRRSSPLSQPPPSRGCREARA